MSQAMYSAAYERLKAEYARRGVSNSAIQASFLRVEAVLSDNSTQFNFQVSKTQTGDIALGPTSTERRLERNNHFYALQHSFAMYERDSSDVANSKELIYAPVPGYFSTGTNFNAQDLEWLYQRGRMTVQVNNTVYIDDNVPLSQFRYVPQTQDWTRTAVDTQSTPITVTTNANTKTQTPWAGGKHDLQTPFSFFGDLDNKLSVACPTPSGIKWAQDASNKQVVLCWQFFGFEIYNVLR